jgi:hypothetical protein
MGVKRYSLKIFNEANANGCPTCADGTEYSLIGNLSNPASYRVGQEADQVFWKAWKFGKCELVRS